MAFRRRMRRPAVNWLPVPGTALGQGLEHRINGFPFTLDVPFSDAGGDGGIITAIFTLVRDNPGEQRLLSALGAGVLPSLRDEVQGSGYRLRRIVGKLFLGLQQFDAEEPNRRPTGALCGAGFIVLKVDPETGEPLDATEPGEYSPLEAFNVPDPWIWRRTWILGNEQAQADVGPSPDAHVVWAQFPHTNAEYGSVQDGPHIDQKTRRVIGPDERLCFVVSAHRLSLTTDYQATIFLNGYLDYRLLASFNNKVNTNRGRSSR